MPLRSQISRYAEIYWLMIRNSIIREMSFKANFILWMVVEILWFCGQIVFIEVLFQYVNQIGDWSKWQVVALVGTHQIIGQLFQAFFYVNIANLPELVRTGKLDLMLVLPVDAQFVGVAIVIFALVKLHVVPGFGQIVLFGLAVALGIAIHYSIMSTLAAASFWIVRAQGLVHGYFSLFNVARYPDVVFHGLFKIIFSFVIPVLLVANVPTRIITAHVDSPLRSMLTLLAATAFIVCATRIFWQNALRRYSSASS